MTNYELLVSAELNYLVYVTQELRKIVDLSKKYFDDRNGKLNLLLDKEYLKIKEEVDREINNILNFINTIDVNNINIHQLDDLHSKINKLTSWWIDVEEKLKEFSDLL